MIARACPWCRDGYTVSAVAGSGAVRSVYVGVRADDGRRMQLAARRVPPGMVPVLVFVPTSTAADLASCGPWQEGRARGS